MNWLITGGCGFIGSALVSRLLQEGSNVRIVDNLSVGKKSSLPENYKITERDAHALSADNWSKLELIVSDIGDADAMCKAVQRADAIVHLAANTGVIPSIENPRDDCLTNVIGTFNLLEAARIAGIKHFVLASSGAPLGEQKPPLHEELAPHPVSPYGASKLAGEAYCSAYWGSFGIQAVALRFGNIYGSGSAAKHSVIAKFMKHALAGEQLTIYGDGNQTRDFIYIDDIVEAIIRAATYPELGGEILQIATQKEHTINEIAELIVDLVKMKTGKNVIVEYSSPRVGEVKRNFSDISKAQRLLGFTPKVLLKEGLARTLDYFLNYTP